LKAKRTNSNIKLPYLKGFFLDFLNAPPSQDSRKRVFQSEVMATQVSLRVTPPTFSKSGKSCLDNREGTNCVLKQTSPVKDP
jgi:hypothetical protein